MSLNPSQRKRIRARQQSRNRQTHYRIKCKGAGKEALQTSLSVLSHRKAKELATKRNVAMLVVVEEAINHADLKNLPVAHDLPEDTELWGFQNIAPWICSQAARRFAEDITPHYDGNKRIAMTAIVYDYCVGELDKA